MKLTTPIVHSHPVCRACHVNQRPVQRSFCRRCADLIAKSGHPFTVRCSFGKVPVYKTKQPLVHPQRPGSLNSAAYPVGQVVTV